MEIPDSPELSFDNQITISAWITSPSGWKTIAHGKNDGLSWQSSYWFSLGQGSGARCRLGGVTNGDLDASGVFPIPTGWNHLVCTYDGTDGKIYLNGKEVYSASNLSGNITNDSGLRIGRTANDLYPLGGKIDDVRIYNYALSPAQVQKVYNQGYGVRYAPN